MSTFYSKQITIYQNLTLLLDLLLKKSLENKMFGVVNDSQLELQIHN